MKNISTLSLLFIFSLLLHLQGFSQESKVSEFEKKSFYKTLFVQDALDQIGDAETNEKKADQYMNKAKGYNREITDFEEIAQNTRDDKTRISALKKASKLKKKRLKQLKKSYKYYTRSTTERYEAYQTGLGKDRLKNSNRDNVGFKFERNGTKSFKAAAKKRDESKYLEGEDLRIALSQAYNYEILALNNLIDALRFYNSDSTLVVKADSIEHRKISEVKGFFYSVNLGMFNKKANKGTFYQISPIYAEQQENGIVSYNAGVFKNYKNAENAQKELIKEGYDAAYVVAYENGIKMELDRAIQLSSAGAVNFAIPETFKIGNRVINQGEESSINKVTVTKINTNDNNTGTTGNSSSSTTGSKSEVRANPQGVDVLGQPKSTADKVKVYQSKEAVIISRLKLTNAERAALLEASHTEQYATSLMKKVEDYYKDIKLFQEAERLETDPEKKEEYRDKHVMLQMKVFVSLIKATEHYLEVNEARYKIYNKHLPRVRSIIESPAARMGEEYEANAEAFFQESKMMEADGSGLEYQSDKYLKLMEANDLLLLALESQEMAFSLYFNLVSEDDLAYINRSDINLVENGNQKDKDLGKKRKLLKYVVTDTYVYSKLSPKPKRIKAEKGIIFKIQFGLFKDFPKDNFGNITPITVEKLKGKEFSRFLVGSFKTWEAVKEALPIVKSKGYKTAFIVAFKDGRRMRPTTARHLARQTTKNYSNIVNSELALVKGKKKNAEPVKLGEIVATDLTKTEGLVYTVQLGVFKKLLTPKELKTTDNINFERLENGGIRYTKGIFSAKKNADKERNKLQKDGFEGVFVVAYYNGRRATMSQISNSSNIRGLEATHVKRENTLIFKLQVAVLKNISSDFGQKIAKAKKSYAVETKTNDKGLKVVTVGNFDTYDVANDQRPKLRNYGFGDSFIVAFKDGKQIPISLARKLQK